MNFFYRLSNGWSLAISSLKVLRANKKLVLFPVLSVLTMILIIGSFVVAAGFAIRGDDGEFNDNSRWLNYVFLFLCYVLGYFIVTFFNTALLLCTKDYFHGEEISLERGLKQSLNRIGVIFSWSLVAATVGFALRLLQENLGSIGKIITGLIGIVWSIATFFVVPVIAYENLGPIDAFKRSGTMMKEKWGQSLGANFSFGLLQLLAILAVVILGFTLSALVSPVLGVSLAVIAGVIVLTVFSAAQTIFLGAVYYDIQGDPVQHFNERFADNLFREK